MGRAQERKYREIFFAHNGPGPYTCDECGEEVDFWTVLIHHKNHDENDHRLENLVPAHRGCHTAHHSTGRGAGKKASVETRKKMTKAQTERWAKTPLEERKRIGRQAADNRDNQSEIMRRAWETRRKKYGPSGHSKIRGDDGPVIDNS